MTTLPMRKPMPKDKTNAPLAPTENVAGVEAQNTKPVQTIEIRQVTIDLPFITTPFNDGSYLDMEEGIICTRLDIGELTQDQARKVRALRRGLVVQDKSLKNGGGVKSMADVIRFMLDSLDI